MAMRDDLGGMDMGPRMPSVQDLDVTVLAFAQWLSEMRARSNSSLQQMLAEMGIIRNGITSNSSDLTEFKRNTATVQQQMQSQLSDLRDKLTDAYTEIANLKKTRNGFEQEIHAEHQSLAEQLQFKTLEMETLKKAYAQTHQQLQQQIIQLQSEVNELRLKGDDAHRLDRMGYEQNISKMSEVESAAQYAHTEMRRLRGDHDQAIANLAENMNRWNDTLRDLSKEFHDFQKVMNVNQQRIQSTLWEVQAKQGISPGQGPDLVAAGSRMESAGDAARGSPGTRQMPALTAGTLQAPVRPQSPAAAVPGAAGAVQLATRRPATTAGQPAGAQPQPYQAVAPAGAQGPYMMR